MLNKNALNLVLVLVMTLSFSLPVFAADTANVTATVTAQNISVSVADGTVTYGIMALNTSKGTTTLTDTQTATNNGNVTENFNIRGQNTAAWTLAGAAGADAYVHRFCTATCNTPPTNYTALTTNYQTLATAVATSGTQTFELYLTTPTTTSSYLEQSVDVTVQAVAN